MQGLQYTVDIVLCIDATGSMGSIIERVKSEALRFYDDLAEAMREKSKVINTLRVRAVVFRDYYVDAEPMIESPFYTLPDERERFAAFIKTIRADGGGDAPESGMEALALSIRSDWSKLGDKRRQIIVLWTDTSAHPLEKDAGAKPTNVPTDLPENFDDLFDMWEGQYHMNMAAKRLVIYAPDTYPWTDISAHWTNVIHFPSTAGAGLEDIDYSDILNTIANSI